MAMFLLAIHAISLAGYTILVRKHATRGVNRYELAAFMQTAIALPAVFLVGGVHRPSPIEVVTLLGSALFLVGLHITSIIALERLEASIFSILFNLRLVFITILAVVFLHEIPTVTQVIGGMLILAGIVFVNTGGHAHFTRAGLVAGLIATVWFSFHAVLERYNIVHSGLPTYMVMSQGLACVFLWLIVAHQVRHFHHKRLFNPFMLLTVGARSVSAWAYLVAVRTVTVAVASYVSGVSVILTTLGGILFLGERKGAGRKLFASFLAAVGVLLIVAK